MARWFAGFIAAEPLLRGGSIVGAPLARWLGLSRRSRSYGIYTRVRLGDGAQILYDWAP